MAWTVVLKALWHFLLVYMRGRQTSLLSKISRAYAFLNKIRFTILTKEQDFLNPTKVL